MAKLYFILFTAVALQCCVKAAQINNGHHGARKSEQIRSIELDNFNLDDELYGTSENNKDVDEKSIQGQRKKRLSDTKDDNDNDDEEGDGSRPISFVPIMPKKPLSKPPPPVDHGSSQAGNQETPAAVTTTTTARPPPVRRYPALPNLPTNAIPTLCDGAVLTCCHQPEVTYDCFSLQGCPEPSGSDNPCNEKIILKVINKFQYYYANRQG